MKFCKTCKVSKPESEFYVTNHRKCRVCCVAYNRAWVAAHPAQVQAYKEAFVQKHPGYSSARSKAWALKNPERYRLNQERANARKRAHSSPWGRHGMKFCTDCVHYRFYGNDITRQDLCAHPSLLTARQAVAAIYAKPVLCEREAALMRLGSCGLVGKLWEKKV